MRWGRGRGRRARGGARARARRSAAQCGGDAGCLAMTSRQSSAQPGLLVRRRGVGFDRLRARGRPHPQSAFVVAAGCRAPPNAAGGLCRRREAAAMPGADVGGCEPPDRAGLRPPSQPAQKSIRPRPAPTCPGPRKTLRALSLPPTTLHRPDFESPVKHRDQLRANSPLPRSERPRNPSLGLELSQPPAAARSHRLS